MSSATNAPDASAVPFRDGEIIAGKYEVDRVLGQGGMGIVVSAHHIALQQKVAIKLLLPSTLAIPGAAQRFLREARSAAAIQSEHVARVLDVGTLDTGPPYMVMEYLTGSDLGDVLRREGRLPVPQAVDYVLQASEAIAEAHARGIVHRDLKPDNVFLTRRPDGSALVKVLDFGLSKPTVEDPTGPATPSLTAANMVAGSPQYMSPEQVRGLKNADHRTDIWALGVILYELLTGKRPFEADTIAGIYAKVAADAPLRPRSLRPDLPAALETAILRCLEKDISRRLPDVAELASCLQPFAPAESQTSIDRIARLGASLRVASPAASGPVVSSAPARPAARMSAAADSLEADIPTAMAMDGIHNVSPVPPARISSPTAAHAATAAVPPARGSDPRLRGGFGSGRTSPLHDIDIELGVVRPPHPAERGRVAARAEEENRPVPLGDLRLGGPLRVLALAIAIAAADMVLVRMTGNPISLGPVRPLWIAGPLALAGAAWLVARVLRR